MVRAGSWRWRRTGGCAPYGAPDVPVTSARRGCGCRRQVCARRDRLLPRAGPRLRPAVRPPRAVPGPPVGPRGRTTQGRGADHGNGCCGSRSRRSPSTSTRSVLTSPRAAASPRGARATPRPRCRSSACAAEAGSRPGGCCAATPGPPEGTTPSRHAPRSSSLQGDPSCGAADDAGRCRPPRNPGPPPVARRPRRRRATGSWERGSTVDHPWHRPRRPARARVRRHGGGMAPTEQKQESGR